MLSALYAIARPSICPSVPTVRPSRVYHTKTDGAFAIPGLLLSSDFTESYFVKNRFIVYILGILAHRPTDLLTRISAGNVAGAIWRALMANTAATWRIDSSSSSSSSLTQLTAENIAADAPIHAQETSRQISSGARQEAQRQRNTDHGVRQRYETSGSRTRDLSTVPYRSSFSHSRTYLLTYFITSINQSIRKTFI